VKARYKAVIFDCDGTLLDTLADIAAAMNAALAARGWPELPVENYRAKVGWGILRLAELAMPEDAEREAARELAEEAARIMAEASPAARPYPGIAELLDELADKKIKIAVMSNKPEAALKKTLRACFPDLSFDAIVGAREGVAVKPDPEAVWDMLAEVGASPHETLFVGDSDVDILTARNSGCYPVGVSWGFRPRETLEKAGAARVIDRPQEIWDAIYGGGK